MGHQRGDPVVVAEPDLVIGNSVVLVHHGHDAQFEESGEGAPGMQVLGPHEEVERRQQHLSGNQVVPAQLLAVGTDEAALPDRRDGLECHGVAGPALTTEPQFGQSRGDGSRGHHDHVPP